MGTEDSDSGKRNKAENPSSTSPIPKEPYDIAQLKSYGKCTSKVIKRAFCFQANEMFTLAELSTLRQLNLSISGKMTLECLGIIWDNYFDIF